MRRSLLLGPALVIALAVAAWWSLESSDDVPPAPPPTPPVMAPSRSEGPARVVEVARLVVEDAGEQSPRPVSVDAAVELDAGLPSPPVEEDAGRAAPSPIAAEVLMLDAGAARSPTDPRFGVRWGQAGLCGDEPLQRLAERRDALLRSFVEVRRAGTQIFYDPDASIAFVDGVGRALAEARVIATRLLGHRADVELPVVYVYATADQMRDVACVNTATQGYYDGAMHLPATDPDAWRTVVHEHVHHVLNALGLRKPMWFHEGLAMYAADERWWEDPRLGLVAWLRGTHLPFPALTEAFPHTADELFAGAAYYQSYTMVSFLGARARRSDFAWFVEGVVAGTINPQTSFSDATGLSGDQLEAAWRAYVLSR